MHHDRCAVTMTDVLKEGIPVRIDRKLHARLVEFADKHIGKNRLATYQARNMLLEAGLKQFESPQTERQETPSATEEPEATADATSEDIPEDTHTISTKTKRVSKPLSPLRRKQLEEKLARLIVFYKAANLDWDEAQQTLMEEVPELQDRFDDVLKRAGFQHTFDPSQYEIFEIG